MASTSTTLRDLGKYELRFTIRLARPLQLRLMAAATLLRVAGWLMCAEAGGAALGGSASGQDRPPGGPRSAGPAQATLAM